MNKSSDNNKKKNNILKMPVRTETGLLEFVGDLFERVKKDEIENILVIANLKNDQKIETFYDVTDVSMIVYAVEKFKTSLLLGMEFEEMDDE
ncbi:MAG: hypothetical protein BWY04_00491 [candidate division CPR1 bacterium ADurb.Bin160]|uniref:Uncharacterized protein n=1 Tax=candidate division CPR1 bacterium ADurb.Bin160 TaxID=1852826 RepID=A0A1V5ZP43_9BACT|nr:MAG: hypothetical protein BWY04_00491 [candidate division CPR1 bacterium ADurb.Bin160]